MFEFHLATEQDIEILTNLRIEFLKEAEQISHSTSDEELRKNVLKYLQENLASKNFVAWFALFNNMVVGTSGITFYSVPPSFENKKGREAYIMNMYTLPEYRGKGVGTLLLSKLIDEARKRGVKKIRLITTEAGRPLYTRHGFKVSNNEMVLKLTT